MPMNDNLTAFWNEHLAGCLPEAHTLKHSLKDRWVRFHALPESKRYPESEQEYQEILLRHNTVLTELNESLNELYIVLPMYTESSAPEEPCEEIKSLFSNSTYWRSIDKLEECDVCWHLYAAKVNYTGSELDTVFRKVANEELGNVLIISVEDKFVFHPYDGGADVILPTPASRDAIKNVHANWLSKHPDEF